MLAAGSGAPKTAAALPLKLRRSSGGRGVYVAGLTQLIVEAPQQLDEALGVGEGHRRQRATAGAHMVLELSVLQRLRAAEEPLLGGGEGGEGGVEDGADGDAAVGGGDATAAIRARHGRLRLVLVESSAPARPQLEAQVRAAAAAEQHWVQGRGLAALKAVVHALSRP